MKPRTLLILLQAAGGLTVLAYPGVLVAGVMALAAPRGSGWLELIVRVGLVLSLAYPLLWIILWWISWRALRAGRATQAMVISLPPALASAAGAVALVAGTIWGSWFSLGVLRSQAREVEHVASQSPLAGALLAFENGRASWEEVRDAIARADAEALSRPVERLPIESMIPGLQVERPPGASPDPGWRTSPLFIALQGSRLDRTLDSAQARPQLVEAARLLIARGARLTPDEELNRPELVWLAEVVAKGLPLPDSSAQAENPLAWQILTAPLNNDQAVAWAIVAAARDDPGLLDRPTRTYGSPLRLAIVRGLHRRAEDLIDNGAVLSPQERAIPSLVAHIERRLAVPDNAYLRERYQESLRRKAVAARAQ